MNRIFDVISGSESGRKIKHGYTVVLFSFVDMTKSLWDVIEEFVDVVKFCGCVAPVVSQKALDEAITFFKRYNITLGFDVSYIAEGEKILELADVLKDYQFEYIEFDVKPEKDNYELEIEILRNLLRMGFKTVVKISHPLSEKKNIIHGIINLTKELINNGAFLISLEGGALGKNTLIYDSEGRISWDLIISISNEVSLDYLLFEAPLPKQQVEFITEFGSTVKLSNVRPRDVLFLEAIRRGYNCGYFPEKGKFELPPSSKFVYYVLKKLGPMDATQLSYNTGLPGRTVREAIKILSDRGLIKEVKKVGKRRVWKAI